MPPGTVIRQWYSRTNYQMQRIEPALPMIDGESTYQLIRNIDCDVDAGCLIRLIFYDRYEVEAGSLVTRDRITDFQCPLKTYSYRMQLVRMAASRLFCFISIHHIEAKEPAGPIPATGRS